MFADDPAAVGSATALGDLIALNLQILHHLDGTVPDGERDRIAENLRNTFAAAQAFKARENSTRELQTMNTIPPAAGYGAVNNLANIRLNQVPQFDGASKDPKEVIRWIGRVLRTAQGHTLDADNIINLMVHASTGSAADFIEQMRDGGKTVADIIRNLELRYGNLCLPEEALTETNTMEMKDGEALPAFIDRLRFMAKMAKRGIADAAQRIAAIDQLVMSNIRRVLPRSVRTQLSERILTRTRMGLPPFTPLEFEKECIELYQRREERLAENARNPIKAHAKVKRIQARQAPTIKSLQALMLESEEESSSTSSEDELEEAPSALIQEIKQAKARYIARGIAPDKKKVYRRAIKKFNEKARPKQAVAAITGGTGSTPSGPPNKLADSPRRPIQELLTLANCARGDCLHCGVTGHMMNNDACPLRGKPLVDRACMRCKKGLHPVDDCLTVFQQPAKAAVARVIADTESESDLNDE